MTEFKNGQKVRARQRGETLIYVGPLPGYNSFSVVCNTKASGVELLSLPTTQLEPLPEKRKVWVNIAINLDGSPHACAYSTQQDANRASYLGAEVVLRAYEIEYEVKG